MPSDSYHLGISQTRHPTIAFVQKSSQQFTPNQANETTREARRSSAIVTTQERNGVERMASPPIRISNEEHLPQFYNSSNNYLDVLKQIKSKNTQLLKDSVSNYQNKTSSKKVITVDLRKHQMQFAKSSKGGDVVIPNKYIQKQPTYVSDNIGSTTNSRIMEENDFARGYDYPERCQNKNGKYAYDKTEESPNQTKKKVTVQVDRLSQKLMRQV